MKRLMLLLFAISLPLGDQLNPLFGFNVSLMFVVIATLSLVFLPMVVKNTLKVPLGLKVFVFYTIIHTIITYVFIYPGTLTDLCKIHIWGKIISQEPYYIIILRYYVYLLSPMVMSMYIVTEKDFNYFIKCFLLSFLLSMAVSYSYNVLILGIVRFSGGFHDPNTFGGFSVFALYFSLYLMKRQFNLRLFLLSIFFVFCVLISESRSSIIATIAAFLYLGYTGYIKKKYFIGLLILGSLITIVLIINEFGVVGRFAQISNREDGDPRLLIWMDYLSNIENWGLYGTGLGKKYEAVIWDFSMRATHNMYLLQFVQYGIFGLLLFVGCFCHAFLTIYKCSLRKPNFKPLACICIATFVLFFFSDYDNTREFAIIMLLYLVCLKFNYRCKYDIRNYL